MGRIKIRVELSPSHFWAKGALRNKNLWSLHGSFFGEGKGYEVGVRSSLIARLETKLDTSSSLRIAKLHEFSFDSCELPCCKSLTPIKW